MAANETEVNNIAAVEATVNRWIVDYYSHLALDFFKNKKYAEFCGIRDVLQSVLVRPLESSDGTQIKIRILQFLSRISDGEHLDLTFESDESLTPLESALMVLETIMQECITSLLEQDFERVCTSLKEMIVGLFIKNKEFDQANKVLKKHFPKSMVGKKAIFMGLINKKSNVHEVIEQIDFQQFMDEMFAFCQKLCPLNLPFLNKAATQLLDKRLSEQVVDAAGSDERDEALPSSSQQTNPAQFVSRKPAIIQRSRLEMAYKALAAGSGERTFAQLEEEVAEEQQARINDLSQCLSPAPKKAAVLDSESDALFQRDSGSPMEASPADQPQQTDAVPQTESGCLSKGPPVLRKRPIHSVARLVVEPDSQASSQCTAASSGPEPDARREGPPQSPATQRENDSLSLEAGSDVSVPVRKLRRRANKFCNSASIILSQSSEDDDPPGSAAKRDNPVGKPYNQSNSLLCNNSTESEQPASDSGDDPQQAPAPKNPPVQKRRRQLLSKVPDEVCIVDSMDSSPEPLGVQTVPQRSSTPTKDFAPDKQPCQSKWKVLYNNAKESKETWSDEESCSSSKKTSTKRTHNDSTISTSGHKKRKWSEDETNNLKAGVKRFGEGSWSQIKAYYSFEDRTNVNLKDRWRTLKKSNLI
ncbi:telomeric repeat binding factor a [Pungitius pungitius]|uniref:telomeric repeat binding factor a n=1 Tax=Pungitius pungitius TaxID=134920 RepID=UPI002E0EE95A